MSLSELRGRWVLLDFWTGCCGNCLHIIDELGPLEAKYHDVLTVIGVHSPKFAHERADDTVRAAVERNALTHPVVNDPTLGLWQQYAVKAWPTLVLIDPDGYVVAQAAGEGQVSALDMTIADLSPRYNLRRGDEPYTAPAPEPSTLRFPAKAIQLSSGNLLVADAGHHQLVELDGDTVVRRFGDGTRGRSDEPLRFADPNGLTLLGDRVFVADTANHLLRRIRLSDGAADTIDLAHELRDARTVTGPIPSVLSPWDVAWWPAIGKLVVAAAGVHLLLAVDPDTGATEVLAGTTVEGLRDGPALDGWLAQPSGLAVDGDRIWFVDSETSALRYLDSAGNLTTVVGEGLFDFGHVDGPAKDARLQHPLGVSLLADDSVVVLDTYNGAVRRYDPVTDEVTTLATDLREPSGAVLVGGELVVVESAAHRLVRPVPAATLVTGTPEHAARPVMALAPGAVTLEIRFQPAPGRKLDERYGPAQTLTVSASPEELLHSGAGEFTTLSRGLVLAERGTGVLQVVAQAASCDIGGEHPACYLARQDWGVPIEITPGGARRVELVLLG
ncbi:MAG TPA: thioredoxin-like domain-containing protein [Jatrophihabitans sp.]